MSTKYTPGPWTTVMLASRIDIDQRADDGHPGLAAISLRNGLNDEQNRANAALISGAAEMFLKLKETAELLWSLGKDKEAGQIECIVAKAEGFLK